MEDTAVYWYHKRENAHREVSSVTVKQRMLTVRLMEKLQQYPDYMKKLGLSLEEGEDNPPDCEKK